MKELFDFDSVEQGTPLEGISIPALTRVALAQFAGSIDDYNPMHLDDKVAAANGKASVFAPLHLVQAYIGRMIQRSFAQSLIRTYHLKMMRLVWPGDVLTCRGVVVNAREEEGEYILDVDVWADNQRGETVAKGSVLAVIPTVAGKAIPAKSRSRGLIYPIYAKKDDKPIFDAESIKLEPKKASKAAAKSSAKKISKKPGKKKSKLNEKGK
ncbi:MaoC family dehydratase N-terminal domain-containing protein [Myxococcota bacterium]|nr:MaoC family dehydratase N-terminal domain-containing protein [Myxococcota bacterium]